MQQNNDCDTNVSKRDYLEKCVKDKINYLILTYSFIKTLNMKSVNLLLLFILLGTQPIFAQQSSKEKIKGYWKSERQHNNKFYHQGGYHAILTGGFAQFFRYDAVEKVKNFEYTWWFENEVFCKQFAGKSTVIKYKIQWLNDDAFFIKFFNNSEFFFRDYYTRITKEEYENAPETIRVKYKEDVSPSVNVNQLIENGKKSIITPFCVWCYGSCSVNCSICGGSGKVRSYDSRIGNVFYDCTAMGCLNGKVKCPNVSCACNN